MIVEIDGVEYEFRRQTDAELAARTPEERARAAEEAGDAMFRWYGRCYCTLPSKCSHCPPGGWKWGTERQDWWEWSP